MIIAALGAATIVVLNGLLTVTTGLLAVAAVTGYLVGQVLRTVGSSTQGTGRVGLAVGLVVAAVLAGALGTWLLSIPQGGVLGPVDYLGEAMGLLLPGQLLVGGVAAWLGSR